MAKHVARRVLAENLRLTRLLRNLSQEELAELIGLDRSYVGGIERAQRNVSLDNLEKIATALGITIADLLHAPDPREVADQILEVVRRSVEGPPLKVREEAAIYMHCGTPGAALAPGFYG